jgi:dihydrofolate synthase/folylpolyglutamate synthase
VVANAASPQASTFRKQSLDEFLAIFDVGFRGALQLVHAAWPHLLDQRWPETKLEPSTTRMEALMEMLGSPQRGYPCIHITGTNGKTSVARMIDALLTAFNQRTGRTTSPHLQSAVERIAIDNQPISPARYVETYTEIEPFVQMVDAQSEAAGGPAMSKFEVVTAMAFAAFADAPVDIAVVEVGMGGRWDATNVVDAPVAVITPIGLDHTDYLGDTVAAIATEKAGIIAPPRGEIDPVDSVEFVDKVDTVVVIGRQPTHVTLQLQVCSLT